MSTTYRLLLLILSLLPLPGIAAPMTKAEASRAFSEGQYVIEGSNAKRVGALPQRVATRRKIRVDHLKARGKSNGRSASSVKPGRAAASTADRRPAHSSRKKKSVSEKARKLGSVKKSGARSPAASKNSRPTVRPAKKVSRHSPHPQREPDTFDMHSGADPIRGD